MNLNEKPNSLSAEFITKINKNVLQDVPGAEIISEEEALRKDQEKYGDELDKKGNVFPSIPIEQHIRKTKQEKDRLELKQDLKKWDKKKEAISKKISKIPHKPKNQPEQTFDNLKASNEFQIINRTEKKNRFSQKLTEKADIIRHGSRTKDKSFDISIQPKQKQNTNYFYKDTLEKPSYKAIPSIIKPQNTKREKNLFDIMPNVTQPNRDKEKTQIKTQRKKQETLFKMDMGSSSTIEQNNTKHILRKNLSNMDNSYVEKEKNENTLQLKQYLKNRESITDKLRNQIENKIISDYLKEYRNAYITIKHKDSFEVVL